MANVTRTTKQVEVTTTVEKPVITLELTPEEARAVCTCVGAVSGGSRHPRANAVWDALQGANVESYGTSSYTGSITTAF